MRIEFDRMCKDMVKGKFDRILVWYISRLGRSLKDLVDSFPFGVFSKGSCYRIK